MRDFVQLLRRWCKQTEGAAGIEFALVAPLLIALLLGTVATTKMLRDDYRSKIATYSISDLVTRQQSVTTALLDLYAGMFGKMTSFAVSKVSIRISSISLDANGVIKVDWSYVSNGTAIADFIPLKTTDLTKQMLPAMAASDSVVLVESKVPCAAVLGQYVATSWKSANSAFVRPRRTKMIPKTS